MDSTTKISFTVEEAAAITGLGRTNLFAAMKTGLLPARKFGRRTIITADDLREFVGNLPYSRDAMVHITRTGTDDVFAKTMEVLRKNREAI